jgi:hypothetical protein
MTAKKGPAHVVVDGSNIATEGRSLPSLTQLNDAVMSYIDEHPDTAVTVVVDATFGHRIDKKEAAEFEAGISNNELVAPPAGAVGRGDAFVLGIADKANATVLSNDSFQEFHGEYKWLFDTGRLVGGKPVPHVGWVFVDRVPVRGPVSRKATGGSRSGRSSSRRGSGSRKAASEPMPVPSSPPPRASASTPPESAGTVERDQAASPGRAPRRGEQVNELLPFLEFVEHHPIGTSVNGTVDAYSSHGAYIMIGDEGVRGYVPLRLMSDPPPRSARQEMKQGESVTVVVVSFAAARRSIDCALPDMADRAIADASGDRDRDAAPSAAAAPTGSGGDEPPTSTGTKRTSPKKAAAKKPAKKSAAKRSPAKKTAAKKTAAKKTAATKKSAAKRSPAKKTAAKKAASTQSSTRTSSAKKTAAKKTAAKKGAAKKGAAKKKTAAKKSAGTKKRAAKKSAAKKSAAKRSAAKKSAAKN